MFFKAALRAGAGGSDYEVLDARVFNIVSRMPGFLSIEGTRPKTGTG